MNVTVDPLLAPFLRRLGAFTSLSRRDPNVLDGERGLELLASWVPRETIGSPALPRKGRGRPPGAANGDTYRVPKHCVRAITRLTLALGHKRPSDAVNQILQQLANSTPDASQHDTPSHKLLDAIELMSSWVAQRCRAIAKR